jgi:hypothetical protein
MRQRKALVGAVRGSVMGQRFINLVIQVVGGECCS